MVFVILHAACGVLPYFGVFVCCLLYAQDGVAEMVLPRWCCCVGGTGGALLLLGRIIVILLCFMGVGRRAIATRRFVVQPLDSPTTSCHASTQSTCRLFDTWSSVWGRLVRWCELVRPERYGVSETVLLTLTGLTRAYQRTRIRLGRDKLGAIIICSSFWLISQELLG